LDKEGEKQFENQLRKTKCSQKKQSCN